MADNKITGYQAVDGSENLELATVDVGELGENEVECKVLYCGVCHSDFSMMKNDWGITTYPFMPGHENVGEVIRTGTKVTAHKVGDMVGIGWHCGYCMKCELCMGGHHNLCCGQRGVIVGHNGGFANKVRADEAAAVAVPNGMDPKIVGPLLCGGATVFNPLVQLDVRPTWRVGVVGIGGLGHIALQFLRAWGCHVTAFTSSPSKKEMAMKFGATDCVSSVDKEELEKVKGTYDMIMVTVNVQLDWNLYMTALRPTGKLHFVGILTEALAIPAGPLVFQQLAVTGTLVASPETIRKMLDFAQLHDIKPEVEIFKLSDWSTALQKLKDNTIRFRAVLEPDV